MSGLKKSLYYSLVLCLAFWWLPFSLFTKSRGAHASEENYIEHHLGDSHLYEFGDVKLGLPVIVYKPGAGLWCFSSKNLYHKDSQGKPLPYQGFLLKDERIIAQDGGAVYDLSITKNVCAMWLSVLLLLCLFILLAFYYCRRSHGTPQGAAVLPLSLIRFIRDDIARTNIGVHQAHRFTPYLLTIFFYILFNNLLGLLPFGANVTGNLSVVLVLAGATFLLVIVSASRYYWEHIFNPQGIPKWILVILVPIEVLGLFIRPVTLMLRLFANMLAGHLALLSIIGLVFTFRNILAAGGVVVFGAFMIILKIFVSFLQAYIFTLLSAMAFGAAVEEHE